MDKLLLKYWAAGNSTNLEVVAAELTAKINELIDELSQLKSESQKRDKQVRRAIKHIAQILEIAFKSGNTLEAIDSILNSTKE